MTKLSIDEVTPKTQSNFATTSASICHYPIRKNMGCECTPEEQAPTCRAIGLLCSVASNLSPVMRVQIRFTEVACAASRLTLINALHMPT